MSGKLEVQGPNLTAEQTRKLVAKVNTSAETLGYSLSVLFVRRGWLALGYADWTSFAADQFQSARDSLSRADRRMAVIEASRTGMSGQAIATALGIGTGTVSRDLADAGVVRSTVIDEHGVEQDITGRGRGPRTPRKPGSSDRKVPPFPVEAISTILGRVVDTRSMDVRTKDHILNELVRLVAQWRAAVGLGELDQLTAASTASEDAGDDSEESE